MDGGSGGATSGRLLLLSLGLGDLLTLGLLVEA
jgi:hypothetical protein